MEKILSKLNVPFELSNILKSAKNIYIPETRKDLIDFALGGSDNDYFEVANDIPGKGRITEATVARCKNGAVINFSDVTIRRRDPDCMVVADDEKSDKIHYRDRFGSEFTPVREATFKWLSEQDLIVVPFMAGGEDYGYPMLLVAPANTGFFAAALADMQGFIPKNKIPYNFKPKAVIYLAPTFRHTHFEQKQVVVHNRLKDNYEIFSYNLYPGPSAKKGVYGALIKFSEDEGWVALHASAVMVITPYDNILTILHEGASGSGKSEMTEELHREPDGRIVMGRNTVTKEAVYLELKETCELKPITDDMALCPPALQNGSKKLVICDAENGWFIRTDHITKYGTDHYLEALCIHPKEPLIFLNYDSVPGSTCLIWEPIFDAPNQPCSNPRVIMPRKFIPNTVDEPMEIDVRSFGIRTPVCTKGNPTYGIMGLFHILPPSLAWLWRLVAPRGYNNPSIISGEGMTSEGVGSYWPFATGRMVDQANLLLKQIKETSSTRYILVPNQHIGAYKIGFMSQWLAREYLARRGSAKFRIDQLVESRCPLLGYSMASVKIDGTYIPKELLEVQLQEEVGKEGYDAGADILKEFFKMELKAYLTPDLDPLGRKIIECCMNDGSIEDYLELIPIRL